MNYNKPKLSRALSESCLIRSASAKKIRFENDPFLKIITKFTRTPALKPTCHRRIDMQKCATQPPMIQFKPKRPILTDPRKGTHKLLFSNTIFKTANPSFSAKNSEKKFILPNFGQIKTIFRGRGQESRESVLQESKGKIPSLQKKTMKRVNSLVFKNRREKSALDFSFGNFD